VEELSGSTPSAAGGTAVVPPITTAPQAGATQAQIAEPAITRQTEPVVNADVAGGITVKAPMPGSVLEVKVKVGDVVKDGAVLLVLEAIKMENELTAAQAGTVSRVMVKKGDTVNSGDPLIMLS
jgi:glutaconyl-CoA/methylmalonyl-CoA decarboxylase subunit gamma